MSLKYYSMAVCYKAELEYDFVRGMWMDTGTFESYHRANEILFRNGKNTTSIDDRQEND